MSKYTKLITLLYLRRVGCRRQVWITEFVIKRMGRDCTEADVVHALNELQDEGRIECHYECVWCYLSKRELARRARHARRGWHQC